MENIPAKTYPVAMDYADRPFHRTTQREGQFISAYFKTELVMDACRQFDIDKALLYIDKVKHILDCIKKEDIERAKENEPKRSTVI